MKFLIRVALTVLSLATIPPVANAAAFARSSAPTQGYGIDSGLNANG